MFERQPGPFHRRDDGEFLRDEGCGGNRRLTDADDGNICKSPGRIKPGIIETGDDRRVDAQRRSLGKLQQKARHREYLVVITFDGDRPHGRGDGEDFRIAARHPCRGVGDGRGHGLRGIGIDDENAHLGFLHPREWRRLRVTIRPSVAAITRKENRVVTAPSA